MSDFFKLTKKEGKYKGRKKGSKNVKGDEKK